MRAVLLCAILFCSPLTIALYAQDISPEILRMHQEEIDQELAQLQQDELNLISAQTKQLTTRTDKLLRNADIYLCARNLTRDMFMRVGKQMANNQIEFSRLIQSDRDGARNTLNRFFLTASEPLAQVIHAFLTANDKDELELIRACRNE